MKFMLVADEERFERSVYEVGYPKGEALAWDAIEGHKKKGMRLTGKIIEAADMNAAKRMAEELLPNHHDMPDLLKDRT